jgi:hypothetical protein
MFGQKQLISGTTHCFLEEEIVVAEFFCLFSRIDGDGTSDDDGDVFLALLAFFHKLLAFSTSACKKTTGEK